MFIKITTFGFWGSPKLKKEDENGMGFVVPSSAVQYKLVREIILKRENVF